MPEGARLVHIDEQGDGIALWAIVNPLYQSAPTRFAVIGTGWPIPDAATYVGTTVTASGFVWHLLVPATTTEGESDE